jgi:hypothetical protein
VNREKYIGLDVQQATIPVAAMDSGGKAVMESITVRVAEKRFSFVYRGQQSPAQGRLSKKR